MQSLAVYVENKNAGPLSGPAFLPCGKSALAADLYDVLGRGAFGTLDDVELNALTLGERAEATALNRGMMDEAVLLTTFGRDKAKALRVVEPLYRAGGTHFRKLLSVVVSSEYRNMPYAPTHSCS